MVNKIMLYTVCTECFDRQQSV